MCEPAAGIQSVPGMLWITSTLGVDAEYVKRRSSSVSPVATVTGVRTDISGHHW